MRKISEDLLKEYRELLKVNDYNDPDLDELNIDELKATLKMQKKLNSVKSKPQPAPGPEKRKIKGIDMAKENAALIAKDIQKAFFANAQLLDEDVVEDERLRWNCGKFGPDENGIMIIRNKRGQCI